MSPLAPLPPPPLPPLLLLLLLPPPSLQMHLVAAVTLLLRLLQTSQSIAARLNALLPLDDELSRSATTQSHIVRELTEQIMQSWALRWERLMLSVLLNAEDDEVPLDDVADNFAAAAAANAALLN